MVQKLRRKKRTIKNSKTTYCLPLPGTVKATNSEDDRAVEIIGYTGKPVNLSSYGFYDPVIYNLKTANTKNHLPYWNEHTDIIGHTVENSIEKDKIRHIAHHTVESEIGNRVYNSISNGEEYEASIDIEFFMEDVTYIHEGSVQINNQTFQAPLFIVDNGDITGISATKSGRDSNTRITKLSRFEDAKEELMKVKNSKVKAGNSDPTPEPTPTPEPSSKVEPTPEPTPESKAVKNSDPQPQPVKVESFDYVFDYVEHFGNPSVQQLVQNARKESWDADKFRREFEINNIKNSRPQMPGTVQNSGSKEEKIILGRYAKAVGVENSTIEKHLGKEITELVDNRGGCSLKEILVVSANSNGGRFNGHTDEGNLCKHIKQLVRNSAFSSVDFPNLSHQVAQWRLEERWELEAPQAPKMCKEVNESDLNDRGHIRPSGGKMWDGLNAEGKITHTSMGSEDRYTTSNSTKAQIMSIPEDEIINDNIGWVAEAMDLMLEGAIMLPDYQMVNLIYNANAAGVMSTSGITQNLFELELTPANLSTVYNLIRRRRINKSAADGDKVINNRFNTKWTLWTGVDLEETAFEILKQARLRPGGSNTDDKVGDKNFWFNRLDHKTFDNLDNDTYHVSANNQSWMILPNSLSYAPFYIRYLNGRKKPMTQIVELAEDMLGFGIRGVWRVNLGYRPMQEDLLKAFALSTGPTQGQGA